MLKKTGKLCLLFQHNSKLKIRLESVTTLKEFEHFMAYPKEAKDIGGCNIFLFA